VSNREVEVTAQPQQPSPREHDGDFVEFFSAGTIAKGMFECVACQRLTVSVAVLEHCGNCGATLWERAEWSPFRLGLPGHTNVSG
jgi:hypothetical protein